jgi:hypothetical protein
MKPNIVMIHRGIASYLRPNIERVLTVIPNCNFWLIGDEKNRGMAAELKINFEIMDDFLPQPDYKYEHHSFNSFGFEKFCIDRWIVLNKFMKKQNIKEALYLDSDVLVLSNKILDVFYDDQYDLIKDSNLVVMPCCIFLKQKVAKLFADYILELYSLDSAKKLEILKSISDRLTLSPSGGGLPILGPNGEKLNIYISDMYLIGDFSDKWSRLRTRSEPSKPLPLPINIKNVSFDLPHSSKDSATHKNLLLKSKAQELKGKILILKEKKYFLDEKEVPFLHLQGYSKNWQRKILININKNENINLNF